MRKLILAMIAAISIPAIALAQASDAKAKADQILKQSRATIGDEKKLKELQGLTFAGMVRQTFGDRQLESELEIDVLMPDKIRKTTNSQRGTETQTFNGVDFWRDFVPAAPGGPGGGFRGGGGGPGGPGGFGGPGAAGAANSPMASYLQLQQRREFYQILLGWLLTAPASAQVEFTYAGEAPGPEGSKLDALDGKGANGFNVRLFFDQKSHQLIGLSYKIKQMGRGIGGRGPGGAGGPGGGEGRQRQQGGQTGQPGQDGQPGQRPQNAQTGQPGQGGQPGQRPELSPEERERLAKEFQDRFEKAPEVEIRWAFSDYKSVGGLNLPHRLTKIQGGTPNEEWEISKVKINPKLSPDKFVKKEKSPNGN